MKSHHSVYFEYQDRHGILRIGKREYKSVCVRDVIRSIFPGHAMTTLRD